MLFLYENSLDINLSLSLSPIVCPYHFELYVPKPKYVKPTDKVPNWQSPWKRMAIQPLIPQTWYAEIPYNMYRTTVQKDIAKRVCKDCGTYFPSHAAVK